MDSQTVLCCNPVCSGPTTGSLSDLAHRRQIDGELVYAVHAHQGIHLFLKVGAHGGRAGADGFASQVEVYALASRYPFVANSQWFDDVAGRHVAAAAGALPPEVVVAAQERGRAADPWVLAEALLGALVSPQ